MKKVLFALAVFFLLNFIISVPVAIAQGTGSTTVKMADKIRSEGKIYVVVLVIVILFGGLAFYAIGTEHKVTRLEKEVKRLSKTQQSKT